MGVVFEYFSVEDDEAAAALVDRGPAVAGAATAPGGNVDPTTHLAPVGALILDRRVAEVGPTVGDPVALAGGEEQILVPLTTTVVDALTQIDDERIGPIAATWSADSSFWRAPAPDDLAVLLSSAATLARAGQPVSCWLSV